MHVCVLSCALMQRSLRFGLKHADAAWTVSVGRAKPRRASMDDVTQRLRDARRFQRRQYQAAWRRRKLPLSSHQEDMALAVWWESERLLSMAFRYLELEHMRLRQRRGDSSHAHAGASADANLHFIVPEEWRARVRARVESLTPADVDALAAPFARPGVQRREKARRFVEEVALVSWVERMNVRGLAVSSRAVLERRGLALAADAATSHGQLRKLPKRAKRWVRRWQLRHGLTRGSFRIGCGLTPEKQRQKASARAGGGVARVSFVSWPGRA